MEIQLWNVRGNFIDTVTSHDAVQRYCEQVDATIITQTTDSSGDVVIELALPPASKYLG